jgi:hypothetical protein
MWVGSGAYREALAEVFGLGPGVPTEARATATGRTMPSSGAGGVNRARSLGVSISTRESE